MTDIRLNANAPKQIMNAGAPLQATKVQKAGHTISVMGNSPINLSKLTRNPIPHQGFKSVTRIAMAAKGLQCQVDNTLSLMANAKEYINVPQLIRDLNTIQHYMERQVKLNVITPKQMDDKFMSIFAPKIQQLDNRSLNALVPVHIIGCRR